MEPGWGGNVGAALAFEEEGEPEGESRAVGWGEGWRRADALRLSISLLAGFNSLLASLGLQAAGVGSQLRAPFRIGRRLREA